MGLRDYTIYSIIKRNARVYRDRVAWKSGEENITHRQFLERVDRLAYGLLSVGLKKGDRIGILAQNSMEFVYLYGASSKIGTVMLPISWRLKPEEIEYVASDGSPKVIFVGTEFLASATPLISKFSCIEKFYTIGQAEQDLASFKSLMENDGRCPELDVHSDEPYVIIHTAAVTGKPRGVTLSQGGLIVSNLRAMYYLHLTEKDCNLVMAPLFHLVGLGTSLYIMQTGGMNIVLPKFDVDLALRHIQKDKVTIFGEFPPMLTRLLDKGQEQNYDLSSLRIVIGLDHPDTIRRFENITGGTFWSGYGQSETSGPVSLVAYFERPGSVGLPSFMTEVEIMDDYGNFLETEKSGEIVVRGPTVFIGYWNCEKDNEYTFRDGWHHTGDLGRFDSEGYLWYIGRKPEKELIKPGGENVYPAEVEKVILEHPLIEDVSVIGVPDPQWGEAIKAVCVLKKGKSLAESELIGFVASRVARYKKPKHVVFVSDLPRTENGLIDREKVKADHGKS